KRCENDRPARRNYAPGRKNRRADCGQWSKAISKACSGYNKPRRPRQSDPTAKWLPGIERHNMRAHLLLHFASVDEFIGDEPNLGVLRIIVNLQFVSYHLQQQGFA